MNKGELIGRVSEEFPGMPKRQVKEVFEAIFSAIIDGIKKDKKVVFGNLGSFKLKKSAARIGRNPATGASIKIPAKKKVKFSVSKYLKKEVL